MPGRNSKYHKWRLRIASVFSYSARSVTPLVYNSLLSLLVIRFASFSVWGEFVSILIVFNLGAQLISWGSKQFLMREFALEPSSIPSLWFDNLKARVPLLALTVLIYLCTTFPGGIKGLLIIWQCIAFLNRSYEPLIIHYARIKFFLFLELGLSFCARAAGFLFHASITVPFLLGMCIFMELGRLAAGAVVFAPSLPSRYTLKIPVHGLGASGMFFLLGIIGMLQSRLDLYFVASLLSKEELAVYHVLINFILLIQAGTGFIIQPFLKEWYRMSRRRIALFSRRFALYGMLAAGPMVVLMTLVMKELYKISVDGRTVMLSCLYVLPIFYYTTRIYLLYKLKKEWLIAMAGITVLLLNIPVNYFLVRQYHIHGALLAGISGEVLTLLFFSIYEIRAGFIIPAKAAVSQAMPNQ